MTAVAAPARSTAVEGVPALEPYKGLSPYLESDCDLFFGRERETELICANLMASRLTLLYGDSGVGKSSVLLAGAAHRLREEAKHNVQEYGQPEFAVAVYRTWRDDPVQGLIAEVRRAVSELVGDGAADLPEGATLADVLHAETERLGGHLIVIFDQFDEYFLYHATADGEGTFAVEFPRAVNRVDLRASFLVSMREDTVAKLDRFKGRIPFLFDNRLRIEHLDMAAARAAIERPIGAYNQRVGPDAQVAIEPALVDEILRQIGGSTVPLGQVGAGDVSGGSAAQARDRIEAPYLQVVLRRLWLEEVKTGSHVLRAETLERLGGCESIVRTRLGELMDALTEGERDIASEIFRYLVTRSGTKVAHSAADLAEFADLPEEGVSRVLEQLAATDVRLLRPVQPPPGVDGGTRYEISHDVIGPAILDWRARHVQEKHAGRERRKTRIWAAVALLSLLTCVGVAVLAIFSVSAMNRAQDAERNAEQAEGEAVSARKTARAQQLVAAATAELAVDPAESMSLALDALRLDEEMPRAEDLLREGLPQLRLRRSVPGVQDSPAAALSPAPERPLMALPSSRGVVRIVDAETGEEVSALPGHGEGVAAVTFTGDGEEVVTVGSDGTARVWDTATGEEVLDLPASPVAAAAIDPNGSWVVTAGPDGLRLFDLASGAEAASAEGDFVSVAASGDGRRIVSVKNHGAAQVWAVSGSTLDPVSVLKRPQVPNDNPFATSGGFQSTRPADFSLVELNGDGTRVLTASQDDRLRLWRAGDGTPQVLPGGPAQVQDVAFSPNGKLVAAAQQKAIRLWSTGTGKAMAEMRGHQDWVNRIAFRDDGTNLLSAGSDGTARVWETGSGLLLMTLRGQAGSVDQAGFVGDDTLAVTVSQEGVAQTWDVGTGTELRRHGKRVTDLALSSDGTTVATVGADGLLVTWDPQTGERLPEVQADYVGEVTSVEFSPEDFEPASILTAGKDSTATLWDAETLALTGLVYDGSGATINRASFSPDGERIVTAHDNGVARVWTREALEAYGGEESLLVLQADDVPEGEEQSHEGSVLDAGFNLDGSRIVTVGEDGIARVWDSAQGDQLLEFDKHVRAVTSVAFHPTEQDVVVTGGRDGTARIWSLGTGVEREVLSQPEAVTTVAFSPDGEWIATGSPDGVTRIWDWRAEKLLGSMRMHADYVNAAAFTLDGRVLTASDDHSAKIYECEICGGLAEVEKQAEERLRELGIDPG